MKPIRLKFVDFWKEFDEQNNTFLDVLTKKYNVIQCDNPDYIFYSAFGYEHLHYKCIRIFYTSENIRPDFNLCDYAIAFDWMTFEDRYLRYPLYMMYESDFKKAMNKHVVSDNELAAKTKFCNYIYSNRNANSVRPQFFKLLSTYKRVDSGGKCLNTIGYCVKDKLQFQENYKFSIAFENSSASGYTTEKIIQAFAAKTIPIYWGNPNINKEFNPNSFINCHEYTNFEAVLERIIEVDNNDELYFDMLKTPIYKNVPEMDFTNKSLTHFLYNIFDQALDQAPRRSRSLQGTYYERLHSALLNIRRH